MRLRPARSPPPPVTGAARTGRRVSAGGGGDTCARSPTPRGPGAGQCGGQRAARRAGQGRAGEGRRGALCRAWLSSAAGARRRRRGRVPVGSRERAVLRDGRAEPAQCCGAAPRRLRIPAILERLRGAPAPVLPRNHGSRRAPAGGGSCPCSGHRLGLPGVVARSGGNPCPLRPGGPGRPALGPPWGCPKAFATVTPGCIFAHRAFGAGSEQVERDDSGLRESELLLKTLSVLSASPTAVIASFFGAECSRVLSDSTGTDA